MRRTSKILKQFSQKPAVIFTNFHKIQPAVLISNTKNHYSTTFIPVKKQKQAIIFTSKKNYATKTVVVPSLGDSITEGNVQAWLKNEGESVAEDDVICQLETAKVGADVRAPVAGVLKKLLAKAGDKVIVGQELFVIEEGAAATPSVKKEEKAAPAASAPSTPAPSAPAPKKEEKKPAPAATPAPQPVVAGTRTERRVQMSQMRQTIAQRLKDAQNTYALLTTLNEIDMSRLIEMRNRLKDSFQEKHKVKLGFMSAFVKAATVALQEQPVVNAVIDGTEIVYRDYVDVSVAVASPTGLVVPVLRNVETKSFADIEKEIGVFGEKAKNRTITMDDMKGGTFTISNGGVFGSLMGTPIINPPQSAILGMHATNKRAVVVNDQIVIRPMMYVALTYDHRIIDGKEAVTFLRRIKALIEDPEQFLTA